MYTASSSGWPFLRTHGRGLPACGSTVTPPAFGSAPARKLLSYPIPTRAVTNFRGLADRSRMIHLPLLCPSRRRASGATSKPWQRSARSLAAPREASGRVGRSWNSPAPHPQNHQSDCQEASRHDRERNEARKLFAEECLDVAFPTAPPSSGSHKVTSEQASHHRDSGAHHAEPAHELPHCCRLLLQQISPRRSTPRASTPSRRRSSSSPVSSSPQYSSRG